MPPGNAPFELAVLVSGRGSNLRAIAAAIDEGRCHARIAAVISDRASAEALAFATERGIATRVCRPKDFAARDAWDAALAAEVAVFEPGLVVLAGFMRIVGPAMLARFPYRMVNVHPALLPAFPGADGVEQALAMGARLSGCTVHLVDAGVDTGPILAQAAVPVLPGDDVASLHGRIQVQEHRLLPAVIDAIARGWIEPAERPVFAADCPFGEGSLACPALV
ncbi:MAG: phosphoribosylglycinamide formyltransferase [Myxococcota bacterium]|nr:phosphoribosylglycinamide formyltransferase [Myxococcota bacterium]